MELENRGKLLTCIAAAIMIVALDLMLVRIYADKIVQPVKTCIAARDIQAGQIIEKQDILEITVPEKYLISGTVIQKNNICGRMCKKNCFIPAGALFYEALLE